MLNLEQYGFRVEARAPAVAVYICDSTDAVAGITRLLKNLVHKAAWEVEGDVKITKEDYPNRVYITSIADVSSGEYKFRARMLASLMRKSVTNDASILDFKKGERAAVGLILDFRKIGVPGAVFHEVQDRMTDTLNFVSNIDTCLVRSGIEKRFIDAINRATAKLIETDPGNHVEDDSEDELEEDEE